MSALTLHDPMEQVLEIQALSKNFGRVEVLKGISLSLSSGEILAIVGDNGAGKSTLIKCVTGTITPDGGIISLRGKEYLSLSPRRSMAEGVSAVYQDLAWWRILMWRRTSSSAPNR